MRSKKKNKETRINLSSGRRAINKIITFLSFVKGDIMYYVKVFVTITKSKSKFK